MTDFAIEVDHVWKKFRRGEMHDSLRDMVPAMIKGLVRRATGSAELKGEEFWALRDLTFSIPRGQSLGVIGPNGAGKSTLLKTLTKVLRPNRGNCRINGRVSALIEVGAGFHPDLTGRENMALSGAILGMTRQEIRAKEESIIDFAGIPDFIDTPVKRYSSGMTARLGFAIAAHMEPDVLLVDEVLSVGDARFRDKCIKHMRNLMKAQNVTVIFISHILDQVQALCPNTLVLNKGQNVFMGPTSQAVRVYLDLLGSEDKQATQQVNNSSVTVREMRLVNSEGKETVDFALGEPIRVEFIIDLPTPLPHTFVQINFKGISGVYLGSAVSSSQKVILPKIPGVWKLVYTLDPNPLAQGEFQLEYKVLSEQNWLCTSLQPRIITIRGGHVLGSLVNFAGRWDRPAPVREPAAELAPVVPPAPSTPV